MSEDQIAYKFILRSKELIIPINMQFLHLIKDEIYKILISKNQYVIKSDVNEDIFLLFIQKCVKNESFDINEENIFQYEQLCKEFDYKSGYIQLRLYWLNFSLKTQNMKLKQKIQDITDKNKKNIKNYHQIIHLLFNNDKIYSFEIKKRLYDACNEGDIQTIELLASKTIEQNNLLYVLNEKEMEAGVLCNLSKKIDIFIPKSIKYQSKEFNVTRIYEDAFKTSKIKSVNFPEDSKLQIIEKNAFNHSHLQRILIPSRVEKIGISAFSNCYQLKTFEFSENSKMTVIDSKTFYNSTIKSILIPSKVTKICEFAFCDCNELTKIEFEKNSELKIIENFAFENTCFESITIPACVEKLNESCFFGVSFLFDVKISFENKRYCYFDDKFIIEKTNQKSDIFDVLIFARRDIKEVVIPSFIKKIAQYAFFGCFDLKKITFADNPQLESISKNAFFGSMLENISIPSTVVDIEEGCFNEASFVQNITISKNNQNYSYYDDKLIIGKTDSKSDIFDVILFARKNIKTAVIPSFIKCIAPYSFKECRFLNKIDFEEESNLQSIGSHAFYKSSLKTIKIPSKITKIDDHVFCCCDKLERVEIENKSRLLSIDTFSFSGSSLKKLLIPKSCIQICDKTFCDCFKLQYVKFEDKSKLKLIGSYAFFNSSLRCFRIPSDAVQIGESAFSFIAPLQIIEFDENIELKRIHINLFQGCKKAIIMIPSRIIHLMNEGKIKFI